MDQKPQISVVIPIYGNVGDLDKLIAALNRQTLKPYEIIVVDSSPKHLANPPSGENVKFIKNPVDVSLAWDYNCGLKENSGDYQLNMQQDCLPGNETSLERLYHCLIEPGNSRVAAVALVTLPEPIYQKYNFWGKVLMARWVGRVRQGISGKFDLIRKDVFQKIGGYDTKNFSFAGEDMDLFLRLSQHGEVFVSPDVEVWHLHSQHRPLTFRDFATKHYQLAESFGALFRRWQTRLRTIPYSGHWTHHLAKYLYPMLPLIPIVAFWSGKTAVAMAVALFIATQFTNMESWKVKESKTPLLLLVNPALFLIGWWGTFVGFVTGKQRYSQNK